MDALNAPDALSEVFKLVSRANKYIDETMPWALSKDESKISELKTVMYNLSECIRIAAIYLKPFMTKCPNIILSA